MPDYRLVDADNHYQEPRDAFTRHMPRSDLHLAVRVEEEGGVERGFGDDNITGIVQLYG